MLELVPELDLRLAVHLAEVFKHCAARAARRPARRTDAAVREEVRELAENRRAAEQVRGEVRELGAARILGDALLEEAVERVDRGALPLQCARGIAGDAHLRQLLNHLIGDGERRSAAVVDAQHGRDVVPSLSGGAGGGSRRRRRLMRLAPRGQPWRYRGGRHAGQGAESAHEARTGLLQISALPTNFDQIFSAKKYPLKVKEKVRSEPFFTFSRSLGVLIQGPSF